MSQQRRDVNPIIALLAIVLALGVVQFAYWRGLVGGPQSQAPRPGGGGPGASAPASSAIIAEVEVSTVAGAPAPGYQDGAAASARFDGPADIAVDREGTVYVADSRNHCLRSLSPDGCVSTVAGKPGLAGYGDGRGAGAQFSHPAGIALLGDGTLLVADTGNHRLRRVSRTGEVTTMAGTDTPRDELGRQVGGHRDGPAHQAQFRFPVGLAVTPEGDLLVADAGNGCIRLVAANGDVSTIPVAEGAPLEAPTHLTLGSEGLLWVADSAGGRLWVGPPAGPLRVWTGEVAGVATPAGIAGVPASGSLTGLVLADSGANCLWHIGPDAVTMLAGAGEKGSSDGSGTQTRFFHPAGVAAGPGGELYVTDYGNNCIRRVVFRFEQEEVQ